MAKRKATAGAQRFVMNVLGYAKDRPPNIDNLRVVTAVRRKRLNELAEQLDAMGLRREQSAATHAMMAERETCMEILQDLTLSSDQIVSELIQRSLTAPTKGAVKK